jgi:hypothetical protein
MLLFKKPFWDPIVAGAVTLTFRRWQRPHVKPGGRYRCHPIGVLVVDALSIVPVAAITAEDAACAGFPDRTALIEYLGELGPLAEDTPVYRVAFHHGGDEDRVDAALDDNLTEAAVAELSARLARFDQGGPWTAATLEIIGRRPHVAAGLLAAELGRERAAFKEDVRKLKRLGLTQSFEVGYALTPRGIAYLAAAGGRTTGRAKGARTAREG